MSGVGRRAGWQADEQVTVRVRLRVSPAPPHTQRPAGGRPLTAARHTPRLTRCRRCSPPYRSATAAEGEEASSSEDEVEDEAMPGYRLNAKKQRQRVSAR